MTETPAPEELRPHLRDEAAPDDTTVVVRGGPSTLANLTNHAYRTHEAFLVDGQPLWGVFAFCALDDIGPASLEALLRRFAPYRAIHLLTAGQLRQARFELLPSFTRPHFTVRVTDGGSRGARPVARRPRHGRAQPVPGRGLGRR